MAVNLKDPTLGRRQLGEFAPGNRRMIRAPRNPLDQATIVSIYPREITDVKETIFPGKFTIPAGSFENPGLLTVGPSSWWKDTDEQLPMTEIPIAATVLAESIINDYVRGMLGVTIGDSMPGIFFIPGEVSQKIVLLNFQASLKAARAWQDKWYGILVKLADSVWSRNPNPLVIWEEMKLAAVELGLERDWTKNLQSYEMVKCFACGNLRNPTYPVCSACRAIDQSHPAAKDLKFANT